MSDVPDNTPTPATIDCRRLSELHTQAKGHSTSPPAHMPTSFQRSFRPQSSHDNPKNSNKFNIQQHARWNTLPEDVRKYLSHHGDNLSCHHYAFKYDSGDFFKTTLLEIALSDSNHALLYAIVAFSCYHYVIREEDERTPVETFLQYYNRSIILLQQSLEKRKLDITTLLTILQLATIEASSTSLVRPFRCAHEC
jgi:hypothetical protein